MRTMIDVASVYLVAHPVDMTWYADDAQTDRGGLRVRDVQKLYPRVLTQRRGPAAAICQVWRASAVNIDHLTLCSLPTC